MNIKSYLDAEPKTSEELPGMVVRRVITADDGAPNFVMRVFEWEPGSSCPIHHHPFEHEVFVLSGRAMQSDGQGETEVKKDDVIYIAPNEKHGFTNNGDECFRILCVIPLLATVNASEIEGCWRE